MNAVGRLADDPRPPESFPYGSPNRRRLRAGRYRIMYDIDEATKLVSVWHLARGAAPG
jgi:mRNA interferase RelE/StbE